MGRPRGTGRWYPRRPSGDKVGLVGTVTRVRGFRQDIIDERGGDQLTVWETFKVYDGQIRAVEAFMRILPVEKHNGGWE